MGLVFASALAMVALVLVDLGRTASIRAERAVLVAQREARLAARELDDAWSGGVLEEAVRAGNLEGSVVELVDGALVVPPHLGWIDRAPDGSGFERALGTLDPVLEVRVREAVSSPEPGRTVEVLDALLDEVVPAEAVDARAWIALRAAWCAWRVGAASGAVLERVTACELTAPSWRASRWLLARRIFEDGDGAAMPEPESHAAARPRRGKPGSPAELVDLVLGLDPADARALIRRARELGVDPEVVAEARRQLGEVERARARLRAVRAVLPKLRLAESTGRAVALRTDGGRAVLAVPAGPPVVVESVDALAGVWAAGLAPGTVAVGAAVADGPGGVTALDGLVRVAPDPRAAGDGAAGSLALLVTLLAVLCGVGTWFAMRGVAREAEANRLRADFLTVVTHELKTPLAGIRLMGELLAESDAESDADVDRDESPTTDRRRWLGQLRAETVRLSMLIENVLDLGRLERGERALAVVDCELGDVVRETVELFAPLAEREGFVVTLDLPADSAATVRADRDALRQALLNVLENALKYGRREDAGPSRLTISVQPVSPVRITVRDEGPGVPAHEREAIFDRLHRGARHRHGSVPGIGLGLELARKIARRHGGDLRCVEPLCTGNEPADSAGACFVFEWPAASIASSDGGGTPHDPDA